MGGMKRHDVISGSFTQKLLRDTAATAANRLVYFRSVAADLPMVRAPGREHEERGSMWSNNPTQSGHKMSAQSMLTGANNFGSECWGNAKAENNMTHPAVVGLRRPSANSCYQRQREIQATSPINVPTTPKTDGMQIS